MEGVIQQVVEDVTRSGWAEAGTWFQKIGHIRMSLINTTAASVATIEPSFRAVTDKDDARQELFERTVNLGSKTLIKAFRRDGEEIGDATPTPARFDNLFQDIGTDGGRAPDITGFKSMLTDKLNSTSNRWIQEVTSIVTGANGGGCGVGLVSGVSGDAHSATWGIHGPCFVHVCGGAAVAADGDFHGGDRGLAAGSR